MVKLNKGALTICAVAIAASLAAGSAQAYVMASSKLELANFQILGSDGAILDNDVDFSFLTFTGTAGYTISLTGETTETNDYSNPPTNPIDLPNACIGAGCNPIFPNDSLPKLVAPPSSGNYAASDGYEFDSPIANVPGFNSPASIGNGSYVGIDTNTAVGSGDSNNNLNSSFTFQLAQATGVTFDFDADAFLQVAVTGDEVFPGFATAALELEFVITNLSTQTQVLAENVSFFFDGMGNPLSNTISLNAPLPMDFELIRDTGGFTGFSFTSDPLNTDDLYQTSFRLNTNADAGRVAVPTPGALALMGIGLAGLGAGRRRKQKKAACVAS